MGAHACACGARVPCVPMRVCAWSLRACPACLRATCVFVRARGSCGLCACLRVPVRVLPGGGGSMTNIISVLHYHLAHDLLDESTRYRMELVDGMSVVVSPRTGASLGVFQMP